MHQMHVLHHGAGRCTHKQVHTQTVLHNVDPASPLSIDLPYGFKLTLSLSTQYSMVCLKVHSQT